MSPQNYAPHPLTRAESQRTGAKRNDVQVIVAGDKLVKDCTLAKDKFEKNPKAVAALPQAVADLMECMEDVLDKRRPLERALRTRKNIAGGPISAKDLCNYDVTLRDSKRTII